MMIKLFRSIGTRQLQGIETTVEWCFYVGLSSGFNGQERSRLCWLLAETFEPENFSTSSFLSGCPTVMEVGPRLNFATAYSTTATDICSACGLTKVERLERSVRYGVGIALNEAEQERFIAPLHDRMTQMRYAKPLENFGSLRDPEPVEVIKVLSPDWKASLQRFAKKRGISWDDQDLEFLRWLFQDVVQRNPTDVELMRLGQLNSEHARHWRFKGIWTIDNVRKPLTLMQLIKMPLKANPANSVLAFCDDSSAIMGPKVLTLMASDPTRPSKYVVLKRRRNPTCTAESHCHPTQHEPYEGEQTLMGIFRDEEVIGRGGEIGIAGNGQMVGNLHIPGYGLDWEETGWMHAPNIASPLQIALRGTSGAFDYGNCYGHPVTVGFFRTGGLTIGSKHFEWFKPVAYGMVGGSVDHSHLIKKQPRPGMRLCLIGGKAYRIGLGGGSGSSMMGGESDAELDFNSVQRGAPQMGNRLHRVVRGCTELLNQNPLAAVHDLGGGGFATASPEIVDPAGAKTYVEDIPCGDPTLSVLELDSNESQERNIAVVEDKNRPVVNAIGRREGCEVAWVGTITGNGRFVLENQDGTTPIDLPLAETLGNLPSKQFVDQHISLPLKPLNLPEGLTVMQALGRVLRLPSVASKQWLTRKVDRSVTGLVAQQQCVGPNHIPVADFTIKAHSYFDRPGTAYSLGERPLVGLVSAQAMVRLVVTEALLNMAGVRISSIKDIKGSANWFLPVKLPGQGAWLFDAMESLVDFLIKIGAAADGGKDSLSMATMAKSPQGEDVLVPAPGVFVFATYAPMADVKRKVTPNLKVGDTLLFVDLSPGKNRLGGSALAQVFQQVGNEAPDMEDPALLVRTFNTVQELLDGPNRLINSIHDRSDGGLITTLLEMAFAGNTGLDIKLQADTCSTLELLFSEEPGLVIGCPTASLYQAFDILETAKVPFTQIGFVTRPEDGIRIRHKGQEVLSETLTKLRGIWEETSYRLDELQADPECVAQERAVTVGLTTPPPYCLTFEPKPTTPQILTRRAKPKVAILREQGCNGDREMAAAFFLAGFEAWDVNMQDLWNGAITLDPFKGVAAVGGFSFADVFDAGKGWAGVVRFNDRVWIQFDQFRARRDTFGFGICNGCQVMPLLGWVPGFQVKPADQPRFIRNCSGRFESRFPCVRIERSSAIMLKDMAGSTLGVWVSHGEGQYCCRSVQVSQVILDQGLAPIRFVDPDNEITHVYPFNPNGSPDGIAGLCSPDGRFLAVMPHPERTFLEWQWPWIPDSWQELKASPWLKLFQNAREWCDRS